MSVNITVNGKFRTCNKPSILDDPVRVKKQLECELRKQRLLEVREESKNIARKIRNDVAAEKDRQLRNLEAIKAQELECWRQHVLGQKNNEYRQAIFQIGTAHNAAKQENEAIAQRNAAQDQQRKQLNRKRNERFRVKLQKTARRNKADQQTTCTQTPNGLFIDKKKTPKKRKRKKCKKVHTSVCHCSSSESISVSEESCDEKIEEVSTDTRRAKKQLEVDDDKSNKRQTMKSVLISQCPEINKCPCTSTCSSLSTTTSTCTDEEELEEHSTNCATPKTTGLSKNLPVIIDIDVDGNDSAPITHGEIKDRFAESNRQFSHVVRKSSPEKQHRALSKLNNPNNQAVLANPLPKPRFTQVSQLINSKRSTSASKILTRPPQPSIAVTSVASTVKSQNKSQTSGDLQMTVSRGTVILDRDEKSKKENYANDISLSQVQCYDYNNKYHRNYPHPKEGLVQEPSVRERNQPNALEQAEMERNLEIERDREKQRRRERSEERGRKALEREQVRRDCLQLTEKLDALTEQYPQLLNPPTINLQSHQLQAARAELKRTTAVEELFLRPAIITCPEVKEDKQPCHSSEQRHNATTNNKGDDDLNLGAPRVIDQINITASSDSCGSILLGYVDDQKKKIRNDLNKYASNEPKQNKLKAKRLINLLERIEELRKALCEELSKSGNSDKMENVINGVSNVRRERERIITNDMNAAEGRISPIMTKYLHDVEQKEAVLEQKLRELCQMRRTESARGKSQNAEMGRRKEAIFKKYGEKECRVQTTGKNPIEIIIKLKNDTGRQSQSKVKKSTKSPRKLSTLIDTPTRRIGTKRSVSKMREKTQHQIKQSATTAIGGVNRQNSYDSNSTSYRSLPARITNEVDALVDLLEIGDSDLAEKEKQVIEKDAIIRNENDINVDNYKQTPRVSAAPGTNVERPVLHRTKSNQHTAAHLNPLIAHYIQRLLGMSRNSILALGVSSSEIETPSSSVMNISTNRTENTLDIAVNSQERIQRVQRFIDENRNFINELEDTLRSQSDVTLETSLRIFEEIWQQRLSKEARTRVEKSCEEKISAQKEVRRRTEPGNNANAGARKRSEQQRLAHSILDQRDVRDGNRTKELASKAANQQKRPPMENLAQPPAQPVQQKEQRPSYTEHTQSVAQRAQQKQKQTQGNTIQMLSPPGRAISQPTTNVKEFAQADSKNKRDISMSTDECRAEEHMARYEQLTENCTQRIAELTELIQKVRTEKKRLMEVTLSSVSEGRNSTEYIELPDGTRRRSNASSISSSTSSGRDGLNTQPTTSCVDYMPQRGEAVSLEQEIVTTSGEGLSTIENGNSAPLEKYKPTGISRDSGISISRPLTSQGMDPPSQTSTATQPSSSTAGLRKTRPPPTIHRYSPNFVEDEVAHELSTILEVDTPGTSRINATTAGPASKGETESARNRRLLPQLFPTFEEYAREINLDVSQMDENTSLRVHQEFDTLISNLRAGQGDVGYREFPSLSAYLRDLSTQHDNTKECPSPETIDDLISSLRAANLSIKGFPSGQEYLRKMAKNSPSGELLDSVSLEHISDAHTNTNGNTETDSESINIEEELKRRHILQNSFRVAKSKDKILSSTANEVAEHETNDVHTFNTTESGVEKLSSTSENTSSEFERQLFNLGMKWPAKMRARTKEADAVGRSNTSSSPERAPMESRRNVKVATKKSPRQTTAITKVNVVSPKRAAAVNSTIKEVQFEGHIKMHSRSQSPASSVDKQQLRISPQRDISPGNTSYRQQLQSPMQEEHGRKSTTTHGASRHSRSSLRSSHQRSSDFEFVSDFGRPLNLRDFLTKELLKHASSSSSSTPTDESLRSAFLQSIIDTMTPRTNNGGGSNQIDRQKTSTPVTHSAKSISHSSGVVDSSDGNSKSKSENSSSQLFSGESHMSSVRFLERSITRTYPSKTTSTAAAPGEKVHKGTYEEKNISGK